MNIKGDKKFNFSDITIISGYNGAGKSVISSESLYFLLFGDGLRTDKNEHLVNLEALSEKKPGFVQGIFYYYPFKNTEDIYFEIELYRQLAPWQLKKDLGAKIFLVYNNEKNENVLDAIKFLKDSRKIADENKVYYLYKKAKDLLQLTEKRRINQYNELIESIFNINREIFKRINLHSPFSEIPIPQGRTSINDNILSAVLQEIKYIDIINTFLKDEVKIKEAEIFSLKNHLKVLIDLKNKSENRKKDNSLPEEIINNRKNEILIKIQELNKLHEEIEQKISSLEKKLEELIDRKKQIEEILNKYSQELGIIQGKLSHLVNEKNKFVKLFNLLQKNKDAKCPVCAQPITADHITKELKTIEGSINELQNVKNEIQEKINTAKKKKTEVDEAILKIKTKIKDLEEKEKDNISIKKEYEKELAQLDAILKYQNSSKTEEGYLKELEKNIKMAEENTKILELEILKYKQIQKIFDKNSKYVSSFMLGKLKEISEIFNDMAAYFTDNKFSVCLAVNEGKINFLINGMNYNNLSTSEKKKVNIAYTFAIFIYALKHRLTFPIIILDEFFDNMDIDSISQIFIKIYNLATNLGIQVIATTNMFNIIQEYINFEEKSVSILNLVKDY